MSPWVNPGAIERRVILERTRSVAIVGASPNPARASAFVLTYLLAESGYRLYLVNPTVTEILGLPVHPRLADLPEAPDLVDVFRRTDELPDVAEDAIAVGAATLWFQLGLRHDAAAQRAHDAGLTVVADRCLKIEHARFHGGLHLAGFDTGVISSRRRGRGVRPRTIEPRPPRARTPDQRTTNARPREDDPMTPPLSTIRPEQALPARPRRGWAGSLDRHSDAGHAGSALALLIAGLDDAVHAHPSAARQAQAVADRLRPALGMPGLLAPAHRRASADRYQANVVHVAADGSFSLVALVWMPGQQTPIHSHRSWCVVGVYEGEETETTYRAATEGLRVVGVERFRAGDVTWLGAETDIHRVENAGDRVAVSLHVYGLDYRRDGTSILDRFDGPARR